MEEPPPAPRRSASLHPQTQAREDGAGVARRRNTRLHPQIEARELGAGMPPRRSPRLHPQIEAREEVAGVPPRRSPRLHPQIEASEEVARVTRRRRGGTSPVALESLPDDDDMLREILIRLPPHPSSLPRASAVCRCWRSIVADPKFHRQFRAHHRKPPLLGFFQRSNKGIVFTPILDPPDRIPPQRFHLGRYSGRGDYGLLDCRHGLVLINDPVRNAVVVCDPINGEQRQVSVPPEFNNYLISGAVCCAAGDLDNASPFKVVLISISRKHIRQIACVYSSNTGNWQNLVPIEASCVLPGKPAVLVGNCLYWLSMSNDILEFDLDENNLTVTSGPPITNDTLDGNCQIIQAEDGVVGYAIFCYPHSHIWQRNADDHGVAKWMLWKTIKMHSILKLPRAMREIEILGYNEDSGVIFLYVDASFYTVQLMSMQSRKLCGTHQINYYYPFTSFCTPGMDIAG